MISPKLMLVIALMLNACASLPYEQGVMPTPRKHMKSMSHEHSGPVNAAEFLAPELMQSELHEVDLLAHNDGHMNTYRIITPDHAYVVKGTSRAIKTISEIRAIAELKNISTLGTITNGVKERTFNLVGTPIRSAAGLYGRFSESENVGDTLMILPSSVAEISSNLFNGVGELVVTGKRIGFSAAGTECVGVKGCTTKASEDIWSGFNSLIGKHNAAREFHARYGTDPYTDNKVLKREIDRLAYADAYPSTAVKLGYTWSGVRILDPWATGVGYYNNGEFIASYGDAHTIRTHEKETLETWGVSEETIKTLYKSRAFTHAQRTELFDAISQISSPHYQTRLINEAAYSQTQAIVDSRLLIYNHLANLERAGRTKDYVIEFDTTIAVDNNDILILPIAADYLRLTPEVDGLLQQYTQFSDSQAQYAGAEIHILGEASDTFIQQVENLGITVRMPH